MGKKDWDGINLGAGFIDEDGTKHPPWAGRGELPTGEKAWEPNYDKYSISTKGVELLRAQHGIGLYKSIKNKDVPFYGHKFEVYHGQWREGQKHGWGVQYDDQGVYGGYWEGGKWRGQGHHDMPHGVAFKGTF